MNDKAPPSGSPPLHRPRINLRPDLWPAVSWICWVVMVVVGGAMLWMGVAFTPLDHLNHPARSVLRIGERDLDYLAAEAKAPAGERAVYRILGMSSDTDRAEIARAYWRVIEFLDERFGLETYEDDEALRAGLVVLLAEYGEWEEVEDAIDLLDASQSSDAFIRAVLQVYEGEEPGREAPILFPQTEAGSWSTSSTGRSRAGGS